MNIYLNFALTAMKIPHYFTTLALSPNESKVIYGKSASQTLCLSPSVQNHRSGLTEHELVLFDYTRPLLTIPLRIYLPVDRVHPRSRQDQSPSSLQKQPRLREQNEEAIHRSQGRL
jgi:hypothetical protein